MCDGGFGNSVPVHRVPKGFVEAYAILIDRDAFGHALQRRGLETVEAQILEHGVALAVAEADARHLAAQGVEYGGAMGGIDVGRRQALQAGGQLVRGDAAVGRQGAIDHHLFALHLAAAFLGLGEGGRARGQERGPAQHQMTDFHSDSPFAELNPAWRARFRAPGKIPIFLRYPGRFSRTLAMMVAIYCLAVAPF